MSIKAFLVRVTSLMVAVIGMVFVGSIWCHDVSAVSYNTRYVASAFDQVCSTPTSGEDPSTSAYCRDRTTNTNPLTGNDGIINKAANLVALIAGMIAVLIVVIGGFMMVVSNGDAQKFANGRSAVIYALVGLVVIGLARIIVSFVANRFIT